MIVGAFGPVVFSVSSDVVRTFRSGSRERGSSFATHEVIGRPARLEPMTRELDEVKLEVDLNHDLGVSPTAELSLLDELMDLQMPWPLFLGPFPMGEYVLTKIGEEWKRFTRAGVLSAVTVSLNLLENSDGVWASRVKRAVGIGRVA